MEKSNVGPSTGGDFRWLLSHAAAFLLGMFMAPDRTPKKLLKRNGHAYLTQVIREWRPVNCRSEAECELALQNYLQGRFSDDRLLVEAEYGAGSSRVDLVVEREHAVELKYNLREESELKRLLGQVAEMKNHFRSVLVVVCGELKTDLGIRLERTLKEQDDEITGFGNTLKQGEARVSFISLPIAGQPMSIGAGT